MKECLLQINYRCNANCVFCEVPVEFKDGSKEKLFKDILGELQEKRKDFDAVCITGGEPTIHPKIFDILKYAKKECSYKRIRLESNGLMLSYKEFIDRLVECGVDHFQISFQTIDEEEYDKITRVKNSFKLVMKGIENIKAAKKPVSVNIVAHKYNYRFLPKVAEALINRGIVAIRISSHNPFDVKKTDSAITFTEVIPYIKEALIKAKDMGFKPIKIGDFPDCVVKKINNDVKNNNVHSILKTKPNKCKNCMHHDSCKGVWASYLKLFGEEEIKPIIITSIKDSLTNMARDYNFPKKFRGFYELYTSYFSDIAGLEEGFKPGSVFNIKKCDLNKTIKFFKKLGYFCEVSDFAYNISSKGNELIYDKFTDDSIFSLYVSSKESVSNELKKLDTFFSDTENPDITVKKVIKRTGELLGYPECCTDYMLNIQKSPEYKKYRDYEYLLRYFPLKKSSSVSYLLNNFNSCIPQMFSFYVCSYECENARKYVLRGIEYIKKQDINLKLIEHWMHAPVLFFSVSSCVAFEKTEDIEGRIFYKGAKVSNTNDSKLNLFKEGDSFRIKKEYIEIFKNDGVIEKIKKKNGYDGMFVEFK